ncbi:unnamed protein product, partial [Didymodactylos carnosus]
IIRQLKITQLKPSEIIATIFTCSIRQFVSIIFAFLLYTTLVDEQHPYYKKYLKKILSFHLFTPLAKLSYSVYLLHFRIASDLVYKGPLYKLLTVHIDLATSICFIFTLIISLLIGCIWYCFVEQPFLRLTNNLFHLATSPSKDEQQSLIDNNSLGLKKEK